jgi:TPP-dependent pyruvate/acetoin dehydrogenase alpha subunit
MAKHPKVDVRDYISLEYMNLSEKEMKDLDKKIDQARKDAMKELEAAPWQKNDAYLQQDVVEEVEEPEKGGDE